MTGRESRTIQIANNGWNELRNIFIGSLDSEQNLNRFSEEVVKLVRDNESNEEIQKLISLRLAFNYFK